MASLRGGRSKVAPNAAFLLIFLQGAIAAPAIALASDDHRWAVTVGLALDSHDQLGIANAYPEARGEIGGNVGVDIPAGASSHVRLSGIIGGSQYRFNGPTLGGTERTVAITGAGAFLWRMRVADELNLDLGPQLMLRRVDDRITTSDLLGPDQEQSRITTSVGLGQCVILRKALGETLGVEFGMRGLIERSQLDDEIAGSHFSWWAPSFGLSTNLTIGL